MDLKKEYWSDGNKYNILQMVKREPEWAANRIQEGEKRFDELRKLQTKHGLFGDEEGGK